MENCNDFNPDLIICSEPLAIISAKKYSKRTPVIFDITEWYPSQEMLRPYRGISKIFHAVKFLLILLYAGSSVSGFIYGEATKRLPLSLFFPFKKNILLPYFPDKKYIDKNIKAPQKNSITCCYTGNFSKEKGFRSFCDAVLYFKNKYRHIETKIILIGSFKNKEEEAYYTQFLSKIGREDITVKENVPFENFTKSIADADICFDLRRIDLENNYSLPIKLFYYAAAGKPVIYSDLKAIRQHVKISEFGSLVQPENMEQVADCIYRYCENPQLYLEHSKNAHRLYLNEYNWGKIKDTFVKFVENQIQK